MQKMGREGPKWGGDALFQHKKTSRTFLAERILILRIFIFLDFLGSQISGLGPRGPTHLGPAWAHPLGPRRRRRRRRRRLRRRTNSQILT